MLKICKNLQFFKNLPRNKIVKYLEFFQNLYQIS